MKAADFVYNVVK